MKQTSSSNSFILTIVRHGQTDDNLHLIMQGGDRDTPLNSTGRKQAAHLGSSFPIEDYDLIYSSDLSRAYETCRAVFQESSSQDPETLIRKDHRLRERMLGVLDGTSMMDHLELMRTILSAGSSMDGFSPAEGAESSHQIRDRVIDFIENQLFQDVHLLQEESSKPKKVLLVTHGALMVELFKHFQELAPEVWARNPAWKRPALSSSPPNTSISEFLVEFSGFADSAVKLSSVECLRLHDTSHLPQEMQEGSNFLPSSVKL